MTICSGVSAPIRTDPSASPLRWVVSPEVDAINGYRFDANLCGCRAVGGGGRRPRRLPGFEMHPAITEPE
jgi:hypothetical protein